MALLVGWARDPELQQMGKMMMDYILLDYAVENLGGLYGGAPAGSILDTCLTGNGSLGCPCLAALRTSAQWGNTDDSEWIHAAFDSV